MADWVEITKENFHTLKTGDRVKYFHDLDNDWVEHILDEFNISRQIILTGNGNEHVFIMHGCYVFC